MSVSIIVPAFNEEEGIESVVRELYTALESEKFKFEVIVVDDGSTDDTMEIARKTRARVIRHSINLGYGAALKTGIAAARYEQIVIIDADRTYPVEYIPKLIEGLNSADMVIGSRSMQDPSTQIGRRLAKWVLKVLSEYITGLKIPDLNSGMRAFSAGLVKQYLGILPQGFSFTTTITVSSLCDGFRVDYVTIPYFKRVGKSKIVPLHFFDFMVLIFRLSILFNPSKIFLPLAFTFLGIGVIKLVVDLVVPFVSYGKDFWFLLISSPVISNSALIMLLFGFQILLIGMVADAVVRRMGPLARSTYRSHAVEEYNADNDRKVGFDHNTKEDESG